MLVVSFVPGALIQSTVERADNVSLAPGVGLPAQLRVRGRGPRRGFWLVARRDA